MNRGSIYLLLFTSLCSCEKGPPAFPKEYVYNGSTFIGETEAYNSAGIPLSISIPFSKSDFLFSKSYGGIYPIDKIVFTSKTDLTAYFSSTRTSFTLKGSYQILNDSIKISIYFDGTNKDTLNVSAGYNATKLSIPAFGFKTYGLGSSGFLTVSSASDFGLVKISKLLRYVEPEDTLFIQRFNEIYVVK